jgi:hypothetical protein
MRRLGATSTTSGPGFPFKVGYGYRAFGQRRVQEPAHCHCKRHR